jgi:hypothetical protein
VHPLHHGSALFDTTTALTTQGITLADLTPEASCTTYGNPGPTAWPSKAAARRAAVSSLGSWLGRCCTTWATGDVIGGEIQGTRRDESDHADVALRAGGAAVHEHQTTGQVVEAAPQRSVTYVTPARGSSGRRCVRA